MKEESRVLAASLIGAAVGGVVGYLYLTGGGRRFLDELEPRLDRFAVEFGRLRRTLAKMQAVASEGWRSLHELAGEVRQQQKAGDWAGTTRQSSPF